MKSFLLSIFLFGCIVNSAVGQAVEELQTALVAKKTATWCTPCGTWGWDLFKDMVQDNQDKAVMVELHNSTACSLYNPVAREMYRHFEQESSTPVFYVNGINETDYSQSGSIFVSTTRNSVKAAVDSVRAVNPVVNAGFNAVIDDNDQIQVDTKVKFFQNATGAFYLGVYVTEHDVEEYQAGIGENALHYNAIRTVVTLEMGDLIINGSALAGDEFTDSFTYPLNPNWNKQNLSVFLVIWEKIGSDYVYVNAYKNDENIQRPVPASITDHQAKPHQLTLFPNPMAAGRMLTLQTEGKWENTTLTISDLSGRVQLSEKRSITSSNEPLTIETSGLRPGVYWVQLSTATKTVVQKLIIQ